MINPSRPLSQRNRSACNWQVTWVACFYPRYFLSEIYCWCLHLLQANLVLRPTSSLCFWASSHPHQHSHSWQGQWQPEKEAPKPFGFMSLLVFAGASQQATTSGHATAFGMCR